MPTFKLFGKSKKPVKYSSQSTRSTSLHGFMGGAELNEVNCGPEKLPIDMPNNLELIFNSGVNRTDLPSAYGPPNVDKRIANKRLSLPSEMFSWLRNRGEPRTE